IRISDDIVEFKLDGVDYRGRSELGSSEVLDRLDALRREGDALEDGQSLFRATFGDSRPKAGLEMLRSRLSQLRDENCGLRLVVDLDCARLHSLWWECLNDPEPGVFMGNPAATHARTPVSRYIAGSGESALPVDKLRLLIAVSSPKELESDR